MVFEAIHFFNEIFKEIIAKTERTKFPPPQRVAINRHDDVDSNKAIRTRKSLIQSRAKSLTSLKNESKYF